MALVQAYERIQERAAGLAKIDAALEKRKELVEGVEPGDHTKAASVPPLDKQAICLLEARKENLDSRSEFCAGRLFKRYPLHRACASATTLAPWPQ